MDELSEVCLTKAAADHRYGSYSPTGEQILYESNIDGDWNIYLMDLDGSNSQALTSNTADDRRPSWHPDRQRIIFESNRGGLFHLYTLALDTGSVEQLDEFDDALGTPMFARYSPSGKEIAISIKRDDNIANIAILSESGKLQKMITDLQVRSFYPQWSSDGQSIAFHSRMYSDNQDDEIVVWHRLDNSALRVTNWPTHNFCPAWSHDGQRIAYVQSMPDSRPEIFIVNLDDFQPSRITFNDEGETLPSWSPDDRTLLLTAFRSGHYQICTINLE